MHETLCNVRWRYVHRQSGCEHSQLQSVRLRTCKTKTVQGGKADQPPLGIKNERRALKDHKKVEMNLQGAVQEKQMPMDIG